MATAKKSKTTALVNWDEELAEAAKRQANTEQLYNTTKKISTKGGILAIDDVPLENNELECVVLVAAHENLFYTGRYDPNTPQVPACYAFGDTEAENPQDTMVPHEESSDPQSDTCATCPNNVMGSSETGRGKACKNVRKLAVVSVDDVESAETLSEAEVRVLSVSVTSAKFWSKYVKQVCAEELQRPAWAVRTKIKLLPDANTQFKIVFSAAGMVELNQELYEGLKKKIAEVAPQLQQPYQQPEEVIPVKPVRGPVSRKAAAATAKPAPAGVRTPTKPARSKF
jgi:hypothetical protein